MDQNTQSAPAIITRAAVPPVGEYWEGQGGFYTGTKRNPATKASWHLITHPDEVKASAWGSYGTHIVGCDCYHDGLSNTTIMLNADNNHPILEAIFEMEQDGHSDFYLPAQRENNLICANLSDRCSTSIHWSSTQHDACSAWYQYFELGGQYILSKDYKLAARAVRRILVIE